MNARALALGLACDLVFVFATVAPAAADDRDRVTMKATSGFIGQQFPLTIDVIAPPGATVEVDPAAPSWNGVEVVQVVSQTSRPDGAEVLHTLELIVAPFLSGSLAFQPAVNVVEGAVSRPVVLPAASLDVLAVTGPDDTQLSPLAPPASIAGGESPLLRPAIAAGVLLGVLLILTLFALLLSRLVARMRRKGPLSPEPVPIWNLGGAEELIENDPVAAYRRLGGAVRYVIAEKYGFRATALTTGELQRRMESRGVDRWQARLVSGLLQECDAVVYAGYRPALERRHADLTMAREIVEATA